MWIDNIVGDIYISNREKNMIIEKIESSILVSQKLEDTDGVGFYYKEYLNNGQVFIGACVTSLNGATYRVTLNKDGRHVLTEDYWSDEILYDDKNIEKIDVDVINVSYSILNLVQSFLKSQDWLYMKINTKEYRLVSAVVMESWQDDFVKKYTLVLSRQQLNDLRVFRDNLFISFNDGGEAYDVEFFEEVDFAYFKYSL